MEWMLLLGFLMGWAVGWIQGSAIPKARVEQLEMDLALVKAHLEQTETELVWARAKVHSLELDLARWSEKNSEWAKEMVEQLKSRTETEKVQESMSESGPKLQKRVLYLEQELAQAQDQLMWRLQ